MAAMDFEIETMRRLNVFTAVPRPAKTNVITPRWVFRRKFENEAPTFWLSFAQRLLCTIAERTFYLFLLASLDCLSAL